MIDALSNVMYKMPIIDDVYVQFRVWGKHIKYSNKDVYLASKE